MARDDDDIVLGTGKLLALFFGVVITWAVFFGIGFLFGKSAQPSTASAASSNASALHEPKPSAGVESGNTGTAAPLNKVDTEPAPTTEMATQAPVRETINPAPSKAVKPTTPPVTAAAPPPVTVETQAPPDVPDAPPVSPGRPTVQVAAFTNREDADAMMEALHKKQYPVFILHNPSNDPLYHVLVGPFVDEQDAEATLNQLREQGYAAILKK